ncbi:MAG TPA: bifunctional hydroxymethylpyrimidine kinase/phosphomethylpyrimidine kinase [Polyangia bacterium]|nr:bifunctional hydroxymethylpyrimidine kinase/phosphomethylpyrimidine kinase [Polyangia bacterium]
MAKNLPVIDIVVVGGLDPGGGAGLFRDVATAAALGAQAHAVGTAWTEQAHGAHQVEPRDPDAVASALARAVAGLAPGAVKIGMAAGPATMRAIMDGLASYAGPVVVDPVLATSRGGSLWSAEPRALLPLLRRATLVTPNAPELAALSGRPVASVPEAELAGQAMVRDDGLAAVLVKGGHLAESEDTVVDLLIAPDGVRPYRHARAPGPSPRGTGCALATAVAVGLARGSTLDQAIQQAIGWIEGAIARAHPVGAERHLDG